LVELTIDLKPDDLPDDETITISASEGVYEDKLKEEI